jgi:DNA polymerase-3 subunit epsilon
MTGGQTSLSLAGNASDGNGSGEGADNSATEIRRLPVDRQPTRIIRASEDDLAQHVARLETIAKSAGAASLWQQLAEAKAQA